MLEKRTDFPFLMHRKKWLKMFTCLSLLKFNFSKAMRHIKVSAESEHTYGWDDP